MVEIGDMAARLVLGDGNMDEWNHARYISTLDIIYWSDEFPLTSFMAPVTSLYLSVPAKVAMSLSMPTMSRQLWKELLMRNPWYRSAVWRHIRID
jgi:hypothetical protein